MPMQKHDIETFLAEIQKAMHELPNRQVGPEQWTNRPGDDVVGMLFTKTRSAIQRSAMMIAYLWDTIEAERARVDITLAKIKAASQEAPT